MTKLAAVVSAQKIKIVTINTWKCDGDYHARLPILAKQLAELEPDIVACQECFVSETANTLQYLAESLGMYSSYLAGRRKQRYFEGKMIDSESGLGILSKYRVAQTDFINLPALPEDNDRKAQQVNIILPSRKTITVTNVHLTHLFHEKELRNTQVLALASFVMDTMEDYHVICGDFNGTIDSVEIKKFMNLSGAEDCYAAGNGAEPRYSLLEPLKERKRLCVDHIFSLPLENSDVYPEFVNSGIVLNEPDAATGLYASDHFGISTTLVIHE